MLKKNKFIMLTVIALIGCFSVAQANFMANDWDKGFGKKGKTFTSMKKSYPVKKQDPIDLLTFGMKDNQFKNYPFGNTYNMNYDWSKYTSYDWNKYASYDWNKYTSYYGGMNMGPVKGNHKGNHYGFQKPHSGKSTSVPEPSLMVLLLAGLFGLVFIRRSVNA